MIKTIQTRTRKWGNSLGVILPKEIIQRDKIKENEKVEILVLKQDDTLRKTFGMFKGRTKKSAQEIKDLIRKELYHD